MLTPKQRSVNVNADLPVDEPYEEDAGVPTGVPASVFAERGPDADNFFPGGPSSTRRDARQHADLDAHQNADLGPCLYLGPAGQRCSRRAVEGGFCARHQPGSSQLAGLSVPQISKRAVAFFGLLAVLWPVLADLVRELIRLLR
jgi:hypothetical protein